MSYYEVTIEGRVYYCDHDNEIAKSHFEWLKEYWLNIDIVAAMRKSGRDALNIRSPRFKLASVPESPYSHPIFYGCKNWPTCPWPRIRRGRPPAGARWG